MGSLYELLFDVVFDLILYACTYTPSSDAPNVTVPKTKREKLYGIFKFIATVLILSLLIGGIMLFPSFSPVVRTIGKYVFIISFGIIGLLILLCIVLKIVVTARKKRNAR